MKVYDLLNAGYDKNDIIELLVLFRKGIADFEKQLFNNNYKQNLSELHKLKGALKILYSPQNIAKIDIIEKKLKSSKQSHNTKQISSILSCCYRESILATKDAETL